MKFNAFRMKSTKMFFIVVHDHPRSKYFYCLNVYHSLVERLEKKCWSTDDHIFDIVNMQDLTHKEIETLQFINTVRLVNYATSNIYTDNPRLDKSSDLRISSLIHNNVFRHRLFNKAGQVVIKYLQS